MWIVILGLAGGVAPNLLILVFILLLLLSGGSGGAIAPIAPPRFGFFIIASLVGVLIGIAIEVVHFRRAHNDAVKRRNIIFWSTISLFILALVYYPHWVDYRRVHNWQQAMFAAEKAGLVFDYASEKAGYGFSNQICLVPDTNGSFFIFDKRGSDVRLGRFAAPILKFDPEGNVIPEFSNKLKAGLTPEYELQIVDLKGDRMLVKTRMAGYVVKTEGTVIYKIPYHRKSALYKDGSVLWAVGSHDTHDAKDLATKISPPDGAEVFRVSFGAFKATEIEELTPIFVHVFDDDSAVIATLRRSSPESKEDGLLLIGIDTTGVVWHERIGNAQNNGRFEVLGVSPQLVALSYLDHSQSRQQLYLSNRGLVSEDAIGEEQRTELFSKSGRVASAEIEAKLASIPNCCEQRIVLPDGSVVAAGRFMVEDGDYRSFNIVKLLPSGKIDTTFLVDATRQLTGSQ